MIGAELRQADDRSRSAAWGGRGSGDGVPWLLLVVVATVFALGLVMIFGASSAEVLDHGGVGMYRAFFQQVLYGLLSVFVAFFVYRLGYVNVLRLSGVLLFVVTVLLALVFVPGVGVGANGASRWLRVAGYTLQPSEFAKFVLPLYWVSVSCSRVGPWTLSTFLRPLGAMFGAILLIFLEPDNGTVGIIVVSLLLCFFLTGVPRRFWVLPVLCVALMGVCVATQSPYVRGRLSVYWNPELDLRGRGHQPHQARIAAGSGALFGRGPGKSIQKLSYLPEAQNDYIAAIYAEEFGFLGVLFLIVLYMLLAYLGYHIALKAMDRRGVYIASVFTFILCFQAFLNLAVVSGLLPSTGLNLPLFSQGGTSLLANSAAVAVLVDIALTLRRVAS